jgi:alpha-N-arabinofuranosidase
MNFQKNPLKPITRRDFLRDSARAGTSLCVAGLAIQSSVLQGSLAVPAEEGALKATVAVDAGAVLHPIDPKIYGTFAEHVGRCVYGGVYQENSPLSDEQGFRRDVMKAASEWGVPIVRWPGGRFSSNYHWQDGVGPKDSRPRRYDAAWAREENNHFGTDEYVSFCRKIGAEPYICVNLGTGTMEEAANWVEYCNSSGDTFYANLRRKYGHQEPYNVRYWGLGNEMYGGWQIGHKDAEDYGKAALEFGKLMKWVDPSIRLVACGVPDLRKMGYVTPGPVPTGFDPEWNRVVLEKLVNVADYISLHDYEECEDYYEQLGSVQRFEANIKSTADAIELTDSMRGKEPMLASLSIQPKKPIEIACDEYATFFPRSLNRRGTPTPLEAKFKLRDALWLASVLNLFQRWGNKVTMANLTAMVNVLGPIFTSDQGMFLQTIYFPMKLYRRECGSQALACKVESPAFSSTSFHHVPYLDVSATLDVNRKQLAVAVVNRHRSEPMGTSLSIGRAKVGSKATLFEINGATPETENAFSEPDNVRITQKEINGVGDKFDYVFPAHSVTLLKLDLFV